MGCDCHKKSSVTNEQTKAASQEDFKRAFFNESRKSATLAAERNELQSRLAAVKQGLDQSVKKLSDALNSYSNFVEEIMHGEDTPPALRDKFSKHYDSLPDIFRVG